jgi:hypothetical protein
MPRGFTLTASANIIGLEGTLVLNFDLKEESKNGKEIHKITSSKNVESVSALGVFHFSTTVLAGGNLLFYENDGDIDTNIIISINTAPAEEHVNTFVE